MLFLVEKTANQVTESNVAAASLGSGGQFYSSVCSIPARKKRKPEQADALLSNSLSECAKLMKSTLEQEEYVSNFDFSSISAKQYKSLNDTLKKCLDKKNKMTR